MMNKNSKQPSSLNQANHIEKLALKSVDLIPLQYRNLFDSIKYFNLVQSTVFDDVVYKDNNLVISAPTSADSTGLLELAIIRLLSSLNYTINNSKQLKFKIIYMVSSKALCSVKYNELVNKFEKLHGLNCIDLTADTSHANGNNIDNSNIICTTPEKWDVVTRKWKNKNLIISTVKLMFIDQIHLLGENLYGATLEAVISRMKLFSFNETSLKIRFIAISATILNINDIATWLSSDVSTPATVFKFNELVRIVNGYYCADDDELNFDRSLNCKISDVIDSHSNGKPTLIFCSTRKETEHAAQLLAKKSQYIKDSQLKQTLNQIAHKFNQPALREMVIANGIGYHHAGMDLNDRREVENLFSNGHLLVLFSTTNLAIGKNLSAHLVIIKSTTYYSNKSYIEYSPSQIHQMIGRAGRPQFDTSATAVIMTKVQDKQKYESLVEGHQVIESKLHLSLIEHLNVEIVSNTINNLITAIIWLKSTFFYARIENGVEYRLKELCIKSLNELMERHSIEKCDLEDPDSLLKPIMSVHQSAASKKKEIPLHNETPLLHTDNLDYFSKNKLVQFSKLTNASSSTAEIQVTPIKVHLNRKRKLESLTYSPQFNKQSYSDFSAIDIDSYTKKRSNKIDSYFRPYKKSQDSISYRPDKKYSIDDFEIGIRNSPDFKKKQISDKIGEIHYSNQALDKKDSSRWSKLIGSIIQHDYSISPSMEE